MKDIKAQTIVTNEIDLEFSNGDFIIQESIKQDTGLILKYGTGHVRNELDIGIHSDKIQYGIWSPYTKQLITSELAKDNIIPTNVQSIDGKINIEL